MSSYAQHFSPGGHLDYGGLTDEGGGNNVIEGADKLVKQKMIFVPRERQRINCMGIVAAIFWPWVLFTFLYGVMSSWVHYFNPNLAWFCVFASLGITAYLAIKARVRKEDDEAPSWYTYNAGACFIGTIVATVFGNALFFEETNLYYDYLTLNTYAAINPAHESGQMVMDSGRVYFANHVHLDMQKTAGFKHGDVYCVVPITHGNDQLPNYDFWAVGVNCCEGPRKFHCGADYNNWRARSGLRLMDDDQRPFFQLAVQQAEAAYGITAAHPVFFHWSQDPLKEIHMQLHRGIRYFMIGSFVFFISNFVLVMSAVFSFAKMGRVM